MARRDSSVAGHLLEQSLQAAQRMLAVCSASAGEQGCARAKPAPAAESIVANTSRKCRSVQFGLTPRDFQRLRKVSDQMRLSRAELARRCLLLVINFLEEHYPQLQNGDAPVPAEGPLAVEQLSLWSGLAADPGSSARDGRAPAAADAGQAEESAHAEH